MYIFTKPQCNSRSLISTSYACSWLCSWYARITIIIRSILIEWNRPWALSWCAAWLSNSTSSNTIFTSISGQILFIPTFLSLPTSTCYRTRRPRTPMSPLTINDWNDSLIQSNIWTWHCMFTTYLPGFGHDWVLQSSDMMASPRQGFPPFLDLILSLRCQIWVPPSHDLEHCLEIDQLDHWQSTETITGFISFLH